MRQFTHSIVKIRIKILRVGGFDGKNQAANNLKEMNGSKGRQVIQKFYSSNDRITSD